MPERYVIIKLTPKDIFFNEDAFLSIGKSNLPPQLATLKFECAFWKVKQSAFDPKEGSLTVDVSDYFPRAEDIDLFFHQKPKHRINHIHFSNLRDNDTVAQAVKYYHNRVMKLFMEEEGIYQTTNEASTFKGINSNRTEQQKLILKKDIVVPFKNLIFKNGCVCFESFIEEANKPIVFLIQNDNILAEYEYIKSYFAKALKVKKINAEIKLELNGPDVIEATARSFLIDLIDQNLIESIKISRTLALPKAPFIKQPDKSLFTSDEIFDTLDSGDKEGNVFKQNEEDILSFLIEVKKVRNRKQLEYLAGKKQSPEEKLRFTLHPHFGFLFLLKGETMNHFCWELLNSHATYIWSLDNDNCSLELQYRRIEMIINSIRNMGRDQYKNSYRNQHEHADMIFCAINHKDVNSNFVDGFAVWKQKIDEKLV